MSSRHNLLDRSPGPASYNAPSGFGPKRGQHFSLSGKRRVIDHGADGPGPGKYAPPVNQTTLGGSKYSFASRYRDAKTKETVPGPGAYGVNAKASTLGGPKLSFGLRLRDPRSLTTGKETPAPGRYELIIPMNKFGPSTPSFSMSSKFRNRPADKDEPGPGAYFKADRTIGKGAPAFSISGKRRDTAMKERAPGPGAYGSIDKKNKFGPAFTMSSRLRDGIAQGYWAQDGTGPNGIVSKHFGGTLSQVNSNS